MCVLFCVFVLSCTTKKHTIPWHIACRMYVVVVIPFHCNGVLLFILTGKISWACEIVMIMSKRDEGRANIGSSHFVIVDDDDVFVAIPCSSFRFI